MHIRVLRGFTPAFVALAGTVGLVLTASMTVLVQLAATALIMGGTGMKGPVEQPYMDEMNKTYLHLVPDELYGVGTPEQFWPATGLTDITFDTSVARGVLALNNAIMTTPDQKIVLGYSQSANIATREKRNLAELRAQGATVPEPDELSFIFLANPNRPNGGILARFDGLYIPILGVSFDGATPDDEYSTIDVAREYDLIADFPKYPLNLLADLNALMGYFLLHPDYRSDVIDLEDSSTYQSYKSGNTTYYLVHTEHLPLLQPLRDLGIPAPIVDLAEPTLRVLIDLAYDRTPQNMGVPTRAGLIPHIDVDKLRSDLTAAAREGVQNALGDLGIDTGDAPDLDTDNPAPLDKSAPKKPSATPSAPAGSAAERVRLHLAGTHPSTDNGTLTRGDTDTPRTDPETETKSETKPKPKSERIRHSLLPKSPSDDVTADAQAAHPSPPRRAHRSHESGSTPTHSGTSPTKGSDKQGHPRSHHRGGHSDAA